MQFKLQKTNSFTVFIATITLITCTLYASNKMPGISNEARIVTHLVSKSHYSNTEINNSEFLNTYFEALDRGNSYLTLEDLEYFSSKYPNSHINLQSGISDPAFFIYHFFVNRVKERKQYSLKELSNLTDAPNLDLSYTPSEDRLSDKNNLYQKWDHELYYRVLLQMVTKNLSFEDAKKEVVEGIEYEAQILSTIPHDEIFEMYLNAWTKQKDPHSNYLSARTLNDFIMTMRQSLSGIGVVVSDNRGSPTIREIIEGGPASEDERIVPNSVITSVNGEPTSGLRLNDVVSRIRGKANTNVDLTLLLPTGEVIKSTLVRNIVNIPHAETSYQLFRNDMNKNFLVITVPRFYRNIQEGESTTLEVRRIIDKIEKEYTVDGIIIDLRRNSGGMLTEAISLTSLFTNQPYILQLENSEGEISRMSRSPGQALYKGPLFVLVSERSASAAEIFSGALQDFNRAVILGDESTYGKGSVQELIPNLNTNLFSRITNRGNTGGLKLTTQLYYLPSGTSIQDKGVNSDIILLRPRVKSFPKDVTPFTLKQLNSVPTLNNADEFVVTSEKINYLNEFYDSFITKNFSTLIKQNHQVMELLETKPKLNLESFTTYFDSIRESTPDYGLDTEYSFKIVSHSQPINFDIQKDHALILLNEMLQSNSYSTK